MVPKDLGIKIGTKREALWTRVKQSSKAAIESAEQEIEIQKEILKIAKNKILLEKRK